MKTELLDFDKVRQDTHEVQIKKVNEIINKEIDCTTGHSAVIIDFALMDSTIEALEKSGYKVLSFSSENNNINDGYTRRELVTWGSLEKEISLSDANPNNEVCNKTLDYKNILTFFNKLKEIGHPDNLALEVALQYPKALTLVDKLKEIGYTDNLAIQLALQYPLEK